MENNKECLLSHPHWVPLTEAYPELNELVWLYNSNTNHVELGCRVVVGFDEGWLWAVSDGIFFVANGKIVSDCVLDDNYTFTHWCRLPSLPERQTHNN
jgi:hypothetical protein